MTMSFGNERRSIDPVLTCGAGVHGYWRGGHALFSFGHDGDHNHAALYSDTIPMERHEQVPVSAPAAIGIKR
ncbi:hypothetical protein PV646_44665 [Streptomyces sp. ID05-26A]|nr:hypothetical protein [Streptomyces sp. ID05-26A]